MDRVNTLRKILPEIDELLERRYAILRAIGFAQPIGRRSLATQVQMSERMVRNGEILMSRTGGDQVHRMRITEDGRRILEELEEPVSTCGAFLS